MIYNHGQNVWDTGVFTGRERFLLFSLPHRTILGVSTFSRSCTGYGPQYCSGYIGEESWYGCF